MQFLGISFFESAIYLKFCGWLIERSQNEAIGGKIMREKTCFKNVNQEYESFDSSEEDPVSSMIKKYQNHPSIKLI